LWPARNLASNCWRLFGSKVYYFPQLDVNDC
jgi:hypothetical protein